MVDDRTLTDVVREKYAAVARSSLSSRDAGVRSVAEAFGYTPEELAALPADANMGLSCGNPVATASLREGETVVDLGCGGGIDVLLAARRVGPRGRVIGIDMTPDMIERARLSAASLDGDPAAGTMEFHLAPIEDLPLADGTVDCLISNCVINLAPDKGAVFREMFRVLKPGGRVAVSDIALKRPLPPEVAADVAAYVGCVAGAILIEEYERLLREAGFADVRVVDAHKDLNAYARLGEGWCCHTPSEEPAAAPAELERPATGAARGGDEPVPALPLVSACCSPGESFHSEISRLLDRFDANEYAASVQVYAWKSQTLSPPSW